LKPHDTLRPSTASTIWEDTVATKRKSKVEKVMHEFKEGKLKSGGAKKVTSRKQAVAIALSEAREAGANIPEKKR